MAITNLYLIAGGVGSADINAGNTIGAAQVTTVNGSWNSVTGIFIAASGTPFASTIVGDYASIYVDGATVTGWIGKVLTVTSSVNITIDVATIKYGATVPTTNATGRSCTINGSWNTEQVLAAGGLGTFTVPQPTILYTKGNLSVTTNRTISIAAATTTGFRIAGYNTTPGDLDNDTTNILAKLIWTLSSGVVITFSGVYQKVTGISFTGNRTGTVVTMTGTQFECVRCDFENTSSNAAAVAFTFGNNGSASDCWYKAPTTATTTGVVNLTGFACRLTRCTAIGGGLAGFNTSSTACVFNKCNAISNTGVGFLATTAGNSYIDCTVYGATVDCIKWTSTPATQSQVINCIFSGLNNSTATTNGINNASGTNTDNILRAYNTYYNVTNSEVGMGDSPSFFNTVSGNPLVTSATDMTPVGTALILSTIFENQSYISYAPPGSVVPLSSGSAVAIFSN